MTSSSAMGLGFDLRSVSGVSTITIGRVNPVAGGVLKARNGAGHRVFPPFLSPFRAPRCYFPLPNATENDSPQAWQLPGAILFLIAAMSLRPSSPDQLQNRYA